ncbi:MAG: hypothetical protein ACMUIL_04905 [bacterium]
MKKTPILIIFTIYFLLFYTLGFSPVTQASADADYFSENAERLKEEGDFENWPGKNGPVRAGIILSKDHFSSLQEAEEDDIPIIRIMDDVEGVLGTRYSYGWIVKEKGKVRIKIHVMQTCLQAQNFLIWRFATCSMANIHLPSRGERYGIHAGDISFVSDHSILFVRNNIHVEITVYDEMENDLKEIAEELDQLLLSRPTGDDARELMPVIIGINASESSIKPNNISDLTIDIEFPAGNPTNLDPIEEDIFGRVTDSPFSNEELIFMWKTTEGDVYLDDVDQYYYSSEEEGLHILTLLLSGKDTGIVTEAQITIEVTDDEGMDERFWDFLLTADEVPGYRLTKVRHHIAYRSNPGETEYVVEQDWASIDEDIEVNLMMEIFDSEEAAIRGMDGYMDTAEPWVYGSVYGGILGAHSWRTGNSNSGVIFTYGNVGIRLLTHKCTEEESLRINQKAITDVAQSQLKKIDRNLAPEINDFRESLRQTRLSPAEYSRYMTEAVDVNLNGYQLITNENSFWLLKDEGLRMGIRKEWQNSQGNVIGVDICKLESNAMATDTASERREMGIGFFDDEKWTGFLDDQNASRILVHGSAAIHVYNLNHEYSVTRKISPPSYPAPSPTLSLMYPIYNERLGLTFVYYGNPYYDRGSLYNRFPATAYSNMSLRYPYNGNVYPPNATSYVRNSAAPSYITAGYNYPVSSPGRYAFSVNPRESYGGYISPYSYNRPLYGFASFNPYPAVSPGILTMLASSNLGTALKGIELMHNLWPSL